MLTLMSQYIVDGWTWKLRVPHMNRCNFSPCGNLETTCLVSKFVQRSNHLLKSNVCQSYLNIWSGLLVQYQEAEVIFNVIL